MSKRSLMWCFLLWASLFHHALGDNIKTLREIQSNLAANDSSLQTLVAEYDVVDRILAPSIDHNKAVSEGSLHQRLTESTVRVWLRNVEGLIRVENTEKAGTRELDAAGETLIKEFDKEEVLYLKTPEHFVRFEVNERRIRVSGFPDVPGFGPGKRGRVLYRDSPDVSEHYGNLSRFFDPRLVFSNGSHQYERFCSLYADALEGLRTEREQRHAASNLKVNIREDGCIAVSVKYGGGMLDTETVFDRTVGYQAVSFISRERGTLKEELTTTYELKNGVYVPNDIRIKSYRDDARCFADRHFRAVDLNVNPRINDDIFSVTSLGLQYGDRMADSLMGELKVWTGDEFVDHRQFKMDHSRMPWGKAR